LTGVIAHAQMLARRAGRAEAPEWLPSGLRRIEANARRTTAMLDELLDLARLRMGLRIELDRRPTDLVALARDAVEAQTVATAGHQIELRAQVPELIGIWDRNRLARVLDNLLGNAVKYSPAGGPVRVDVGRTGETARLVVSDRGIGIPSADLPSILERFTRASNARGFAGTGVGLWSVQQLVAAHGGEVEIESQEGMGTTVTVLLPLEPTEPAQGGPPGGLGEGRTAETLAG
jgi:signal transduction histidine kinase